MAYQQIKNDWWWLLKVHGKALSLADFSNRFSERSLTLITVGKSADEISVPGRVKFEFSVSVSEIHVVQQMMENTQCQDSERIEITIRLTFNVNKDISLPDGFHTPLIMVPLNIQLIIIISEVLLNDSAAFPSHVLIMKFPEGASEILICLHKHMDHKKCMGLCKLWMWFI